MPDYDFTDVPDIQEYDLLPQGVYQCRLEEVRERQTSSGYEQWGLGFVVETGPHKRSYVWDDMNHSPKATQRVKKICSSLGLDASGKLSVTQEAIKGRSCLLTVGIREYNGKKRNFVPFDGYAPTDGGAEGHTVGEEERKTPF